jgi:hypothetical protein
VGKTSPFPQTPSPVRMRLRRMRPSRCDGPCRDRTCDLGIKSPSQLSETSCARLKKPANARLVGARNCFVLHLIEASPYAHRTRSQRSLRASRGVWTREAFETVTPSAVLQPGTRNQMSFGPETAWLSRLSLVCTGSLYRSIPRRVPGRLRELSALTSS